MAQIHLSEHIWHDPEVKSYIMLDVTSDIGIQQPQVLDGIELLAKEEYHVSLVPVSKLTDDIAVVERIVDDISQFLDDNPKAIAFEGLGEERYICRKDDEVTMVAPAMIIGAEGLRKIVRQHVPSYAPAFPHVTLLKSANSPYGIGINSVDDLNMYCQQIELRGA